jgi:hypothetical protein
VNADKAIKIKLNFPYPAFSIASSSEWKSILLIIKYSLNLNLILFILCYRTWHFLIQTELLSTCHIYLFATDIDHYEYMLKQL